MPEPAPGSLLAQAPARRLLRRALDVLGRTEHGREVIEELALNAAADSDGSMIVRGGQLGRGHAGQGPREMGPFGQEGDSSDH